MSNEIDTADGTLVMIVVEDNGHWITVIDAMYDDENAVFLRGSVALTEALEEYPDARVMPWQPWSGEFDEVLSRAPETDGCRWVEDTHGNAMHLCLCADEDDEE